jgi:hypothetical protein
VMSGIETRDIQVQGSKSQMDDMNSPDMSESAKSLVDAEVLDKFDTIVGIPASARHRSDSRGSEAVTVSSIDTDQADSRPPSAKPTHNVADDPESHRLREEVQQRFEDLVRRAAHQEEMHLRSLSLSRSQPTTPRGRTPTAPTAPRSPRSPRSATSARSAGTFEVYVFCLGWLTGGLQRRAPPCLTGCTCWAWCRRTTGAPCTRSRRRRC